MKAGSIQMEEVLPEDEAKLKSSKFIPFLAQEIRQIMAQVQMHLKVVQHWLMLAGF